MMTGVRNILWLLPLLSFVAWPVWGPGVTRFLTPRGGLETTLQADSAVKSKKFTMQGVRFIQEQGGLKDWRIDAKRLASGASDSVLLMDKVNAVVYQQKKEKFHITSDEGRYDTKDEILTLENNVRVATKDGYEMYTPFLQYHDKSGKMTSKAKVRIVGKGLDVRGKGLRYDMNTGAYVLGGRVTCITW